MERVKEFMASRKMSQHQLDSFDDFLTRKIPAAVAAGNENFVNIKTDESPSASFRITVGGLRYLRPTYRPKGADHSVQLLPNVCRALGMSYSLTLAAVVTISVDDGDKVKDVVFDDVVLGKLPLMLHSELCYLSDMSREDLVEAGEDPDDPGGYFIVWGAEKVIVTQERAAPNTPVVSHKREADKDEWMLSIRSSPMDNPVTGVTTKLVARRDGAGGYRVYVRIPGRFVTDVDIAVVFRALGVETDKAIVSRVVDMSPETTGARDEKIADMMRGSLAAGHETGAMSQADAVRHLGPLTPYGSDRISTRSDKDGARGRTHAMYILRREFLAGAGDGFPAKAMYLGRLVERLLLSVAGLREMTDRESMRAKRLFPSGMLLAEVFAEAYVGFRREATNALDRAWYRGPWRNGGDVTQVVTKANVSSVFDHAPVTSVMQSSMRGNWGKHDKSEEGGIVQDLARLSWLQFLSHLRRTNNPIDRSLKITTPHDLHATQWGYLCPIESPDGSNVGLTNNLALLCSVTADSSPAPVLRFVAGRGAEPYATSTAEKARSKAKSVVFVNGIPAFTHDDPKKLVAALRQARREGELDEFVSVRWDIPMREVHLWTDGGRCARPLFRIGGKKNETEYLDVDESENALIAWSAEEAGEAHTHAEIHPTACLSVYVVTVPLIQHNPGARNVLGAQQGKQAAGLYTSSWRTRIDKTGMVLNYPQRAMVKTAFEEDLAVHQHPGGVNTVVAVMCYSGYNQEDGLIVNRTALERGLFGMTYLKNAMYEEETSADGVAVRFGNPGNSEALDSNGMPIEDRPVYPGDALIGRVRREGAGEEFTAVQSRPADENWEGYVVDKVVVYNKPDDKVKVAKARYRKIRTPKLGDKLASRHGQKGVIGIALPEDKMPFTKDGIVPDIIVNPHAFPSRMTLGQFFDCLGSKAGSLTGEKLEATPFQSVDVASLGDSLRAAGFAASCEEVMYNGSTGEEMGANVFVGPTYYQRLKQMSEDKINHRGSKGGRDDVTGQPIGGRARGGGLRIGEMENNSILAHGVMGFAAESMGERSDRMSVWTDGEGVQAVYNQRLDMFKQASAGDEDRRFKRHDIPRGFTAFRHELTAMGVDMLYSSESVEHELSEDIRFTCGIE
nr:DNA-directed RNA polymerase II subunit Rpb2 [Oceanusvirus sp.]